MTDTINQVREALVKLRQCADFVADASDVDDLEIRAMQLVRLVKNEVERLSPMFPRVAPAPDVPSSEEVEAIRARHEACCFTVTKTEWNEREAFKAHADRATLLRALDAERAKRGEVEAELAKRLEPDMFWSFDSESSAAYSVEELLEEADDDEGIIEVQQAIRCSDAAYVYRFIRDPETDDHEVSIEMMPDEDYKHYRAAMSIASGARQMWQEMVDIEAAKLFEANPAPLPAWMHGKPWRSIDWSYRKHHRRLAHEQLAATLAKETP